MCTALISIDPESSVPFLLLFARDEMADRAWAAPGRHWPRHHPRLFGGMDLREGGTWLAVRAPEPASARDGGATARPEDTSRGRGRVACLLNGLGRPAAGEGRLSRGRLPLAAADGEAVREFDLGRYDPFHLLTGEVEARAESGAGSGSGVASESGSGSGVGSGVASESGSGADGKGDVSGTSGMSLLTWDGESLVERRLGPGTHLVSNRGLEAEAAPLEQAPERAVRLIDARIRHFRPLLRESARPTPRPGRGTTREAWGAWMRLAGGDGLDPTDLRALIGRHDWGHGQVWLTSSVSLVALGPSGARFDVNLDPRAAEWSEVRLDS